jgi:hypothetical protein
MDKASKRTYEAADALAFKDAGIANKDIEPSGNTKDGWVFTFTHDGQDYLVEVCASTLSDEEILELEDL